tara:strand:- start:278 stop:880 length:603 start_codon:yes stop_codon:yes gene_type:complete
MYESNLNRRTLLEIMGTATVLGLVGCVGRAIVPVTPHYTLQGEPKREELHAKLATEYNQVNSDQEFLERIQDHTGPVVTLVESPDLNIGNQTRIIHEWNAMRYFTRLRREVGELEAYGEPALWIYLNIGDNLNQTALGDLVERDSFYLVERPQIFLMGGGSASPLERGLSSKTVTLRHEEVIPTVVRDAAFIRKKILGEE